MQSDVSAREALSETKPEEQRLAAAARSAPGMEPGIFSPQVSPAEGAPGSNSESSTPASTRMTSANQLRPSPLPSGF